MSRREMTFRYASIHAFIVWLADGWAFAADGELGIPCPPMKGPHGRYSVLLEKVK